MDIVRKHYDVDNVVKICYEKSGVDKSELHEFEVTTDLKNIPNSHALKVYLRCCGELSNAIDTQSNKILLTNFLKYLDDLPLPYQLIYINMTKGCMARAGKVTDPLEYPYAFAICCKKNDNEVNIGQTKQKY